MTNMTNRAVLMLLSSTLIAHTIASAVEMNTDLNANGAFSDLMTVKASYFRSLCDANPLAWDQGLADKAAKQVWSCDLQYDVC